MEWLIIQVILIFVKRTFKGIHFKNMECSRDEDSKRKTQKVTKHVSVLLNYCNLKRNV